MGTVKGVDMGKYHEQSPPMKRNIENEKKHSNDFDRIQ